MSSEQIGLNDDTADNKAAASVQDLVSQVVSLTLQLKEKSQQRVRFPLNVEEPLGTEIEGWTDEVEDVVEDEEALQDVTVQETDEDIQELESEEKLSVSIKDSKTAAVKEDEKEDQKEICTRHQIPHVDLSIIDFNLLEHETEEVSIEEELVVGEHEYIFPDLQDPGIDNALYNTTEKKPVYNEAGQQCYLDVCKALGVMPSLKFLTSLLRTKVNFRYYGLNPVCVRAVAESLMNNKTVTEVDLEDNWLTRDAAFHLGEMLKYSVSITRLSLHGCRIGAQGAQRLCDGLKMTKCLNDLDLSWNELCDDGMEELVAGLSANSSVHKLNLSHNKLENGAGLSLGLIMSENATIENLNLSWNQLYPKEGFTALSKGLIGGTVTELHLPWNGLGKDAGKPLRELLSKNKTILFLDISNNRLTGPPINSIKTGMMKNRYLEILKIGFNPLSQEDTMTLLSILTMQLPVMRVLDLDNVWVDKEFLELQTSIMEHRDDTSIVVGGVYSNYVLKGPDVKKLLLARATYEGMHQKRKKQRRHFGHFLLTVEEKPVGKKKFRTLIRDFKLKLSENLVGQIMKNFQIGRKKVDPLAIKQYYMMLYPDTKLPEIKKKKKKEKKKSKERKKKSKQSETESATTETYPDTKLSEKKKKKGKGRKRKSQQSGTESATTETSTAVSSDFE